MAAYFITYDLLKPGQDYSTLHAAIRSIDGLAWHGLESVWVVNSSQTASQIRVYLQRFVDANDRILVMATGQTWSSFNLPDLDRLHRITGTVPVAA